MKRPRRIPAGEFRDKCLRLLDEVPRTRKEIVITKRGKPVARVLPPEEMPQIFGRMRGTVKILGYLVGPTGETWDAERGILIAE